MKMNEIMMMGTVVRNPEVRWSRGESAIAIARFSICMDRIGRAGSEAGSDYVNCICYESVAEYVEKQVKEGSKVFVYGRLLEDSYIGKDKKKVYYTEVVSSQVIAVDAPRSFNKAVIMGRLTKDPEVRWSQGEKPIAIARYTLAVDRRGKGSNEEKTADFFNVVSFGAAAEFVEKYLRKGTKIAVSGRLTSGSYENQEKQKVYTLEITSERISFAERKNAGTSEVTSNRTPNTDGGFINIPEGFEEEIPFH